MSSSTGSTGSTPTMTWEAVQARKAWLEGHRDCYRECATEAWEQEFPDYARELLYLCALQPCTRCRGKGVRHYRDDINLVEGWCLCEFCYNSCGLDQMVDADMEGPDAAKWKSVSESDPPQLGVKAPYQVVLINLSRNPAGSLLEGGVAGAWVLEQLGARPEAPQTGHRGVFGEHWLLTWARPALIKESNGETWTFLAAIVHRYEAGDVDIEYYDTQSKAEAAWQVLRDEYQEFLAETEQTRN
jgi:hypothetical protein